jgi:hypothetical protein
VLSGCARFVEEAYRGETQTLTEGGIRLYQWVALATALAGCAILIIPCDSLTVRPAWSAKVFLVGRRRFCARRACVRGRFPEVQSAFFTRRVGCPANANANAMAQVAVRASSVGV